MNKNKIKIFYTAILLTMSGCSLQKNTPTTPTAKIAITSTPIPTVAIIKPTVTIAPTVTTAPMVTITPTATPKPTITPTTIPKASITVKPEMHKKLHSKTLEFMDNYDYFNSSITGTYGKQMNIDELKEAVKPYGTMIGNIGMSINDYKETMQNKWLDCTNYTEKYNQVSVDLKKSYTYDDLVNIMKELSKLDGVYVYKIGKSTLGKDLYSIEIDRTTVENPEVIILTGNVHARETAGSEFIIKELVDLLNTSDSEAVNEYLSKIKIAAVPCVNPDGRDGVAFDTKNYTYDDGQYWKATANGTDLNRNFPGLSWGQLKKGNSKAYSWSNSSNSLYYAGDSAGSCSETRAMMKFLYHYVVVEQAQTLIDYHQQGRIGYAGKPWQTKIQEKRCIDLAKSMFKYMNEGNSPKYSYTPEEKKYGLSGEGSTLTDYACSLAVGSKFSPQYGFNVMFKNNVEYPLIAIGDLDNYSFDEANSNFGTMTFEIGSGRSYLGYSEKTRNLLNEEYYKYKYDKVLYKLFDYTLQNSKVEEKTK